MLAYEIDPAPNANPDRLAEIERERRAMGQGGAFFLVVPASDPDHGAIFGDLMSRLAADATPLPRRRSGEERRAHDLAAYGEAYVRIAEQRHPNMYKGER